jgi:hypothetical protein
LPDSEKERELLASGEEIQRRRASLGDFKEGIRWVSKHHVLYKGSKDGGRGVAVMT